MKKVVLLTSAIAVIGLVIWLLTPSYQEPLHATSNNQPGKEVAVIKATEGTLNDATSTTIGFDDPSLLLSNLAQEMRTKFGDQLNLAIGKLKMIVDLRNWFTAQFPEDWLEKLIEFLKKEFPEDAEKLVAMLQALLEYEAFAQGLDLTQFSSPDDLNQYMWDQRQRLFGEEAADIWEDDHKASLMRDNMKALGETAGNFSELQQQYVDERISVYGKTAFVDQSSEVNNLMNEFLTLNNVQNELKNMPADERNSSLRDFRKNLGMDEKALDRWETLDEKRDKAWQHGAEYMSRRATLVESFSGAELNEKVSQLQAEIFSEAHAETLRKEEAAGFFRYQRKRTIGVN